ncbi:hypothetical protein [Litorivivens sp.]|uniref:hypothetical protein n=1 Tax=Litorivivens sp. TaxID=2020868 RepID=UPI003567E3CD
MSRPNNTGLGDFLVGFGVGVLLTIFVVAVIDLGKQGAIAAHKGEIVCIQIPYKEPRWECGEP